MDTHTDTLESKQIDLSTAKSQAGNGLTPLNSVLWEAFRPLGPLAVNLLWFSQPGFALFGKAEWVDRLAALLENPEADQTDSGKHL
jgi:hypothetical protein